MKTFCCGCKKVRQPDGTWKTEEIDIKTSSSSLCPDCLAINRKILKEKKKQKNMATPTGCP